MEKCLRCNRDAKVKVLKRLGVIPIKPIFLCEIHQRQFQRREDLFVIIGLTVSLLVVFFSLSPWQLFSPDTAIAPTPIEAMRQKADLDGDGRVSWFEQQSFANPDTMANLQATGYPFARVLTPDTPTRAIKKKIKLESFFHALNTPDEEGQTLLHRFNHPLLMREFIKKHGDPTAAVQIRAIFLTHDPYLAIVLAKPQEEEPSLICLERLTPDQQKAVDLLENAPIKKPKINK